MTAVRDYHTALVEGIGEYPACKLAAEMILMELWQALTNEPMDLVVCDYILSYPVPKPRGAECPSG